MDLNSNEEIQDNELKQMNKLTVDCLCIPLVVRKILEHFSKSQLLQLSLVSKLWNYEARSLLEERGSLIVNLRPHSPCQDLVALASDLQAMNIAPIFNGINIQLGFFNCLGCKLSTTGKLDSSLNIILEIFKWRHLSVTLDKDWDQCRSYQAFLLVKKVLQDKSGDLVEISLKAECNLGELFIQEFIQGRSFPRLKTLKIQIHLPSNDSTRLDLAFAKMIVSCAPRLQKLYASDLLLMENILEGRSSAVLVPTYKFDPWDEISERVLQVIRLESIRLEETFSRERLDVERFNKRMRLLLKNSWNTLSSVRMELIFTVPLMNFGTCLVNVRELEICMQSDILASYPEEMLNLVKSFDFTRIFPNLNQVQIVLYYGYSVSQELMSEFLEQQNGAAWDHLSDRAINIKHVSFSRFPRLPTVQFLSEMFPNVETLSVGAPEEAEIPLGLLQEHWLNLKEINFPQFSALKYVHKCSLSV